MKDPYQGLSEGDRKIVALIQPVFLAVHEVHVFERLKDAPGGERTMTPRRIATASSAAAMVHSNSNTAENFFSILQRGVIGTYHHWSEAHIHRYLAELDLRYFTKDTTDSERAATIQKGMEGRRLTIGGLVRSPPSITLRSPQRRAPQALDS